MDPSCINVQQAKTHLSALLARVAAGERVSASCWPATASPSPSWCRLIPARAGSWASWRDMWMMTSSSPCPTKSWSAGLMRLLLDTHVLLWALLKPQKLSPELRHSLENSDNSLVVSAASAWEIATKWRLGKLRHARSVVENYAMAKHLPLIFPPLLMLVASEPSPINGTPMAHRSQAPLQAPSS